MEGGGELGTWQSCLKEGGSGCTRVVYSLGDFCSRREGQDEGRYSRSRMEKEGAKAWGGEAGLAALVVTMVIMRHLISSSFGCCCIVDHSS